MANLYQQSLCKYEQLSNWESRPLRKSQKHYAGLDASVLIDIANTLILKAEKEDLAPIDDFIETIDDLYFAEKEKKAKDKKRTIGGKTARGNQPETSDDAPIEKDFK